MLRAIIYTIFLFSGFSALVYQVLWTRLLTLTFGVTTLAVSAVLSAFFTGLALGSFFGGRWVDRRGDGLKWYGLAEIVIGVYSFLFFFLLDMNNSIYISAARASGFGFYGLSLIKFVLAWFLLLVPTVMMGATLPFLTRSLAGAVPNFTRVIGSLYAVNTAGAVLGAALTAFVLIPAIGVERVTYWAGALGILVGVIALFARGIGAPEKTRETEAASLRMGYYGHDLPRWFSCLVVVGFAVSGFSALAYEVIWTRILAFILTGTVYAFAAVLAVFLTGIAAGSFVASRFLFRLKNPCWAINLFWAVEALIGISSIALIALYERLPSYGLYARLTSTPVWSEFVWLNFLVSFMLLFVPALLFGATFPIVSRIYSRGPEDLGKDTGAIYSINTVGGILGSFAAGFILIPFLGMQKAIVLVGGLNVAVSLSMALFNPFSSRTARYALSVAAVGGLVVSILVLPPDMPRSLHERLLGPGERMLFYEEGATATVMVAERTGRDIGASNKRLWINGNMATAAFYEGLQINRFQGALPVVLHPGPKDILVICFGSGTTFGTLSSFDAVEGVDNVEISPTVIKAAPLFGSENNGVLNNPKARLISDDGRSFLAVTDKRYDIITEEPMHPALSGVINLYTREYYELVKAHLNEGGMMSQWIPLYNLSEEDVRMLAATFTSVFPHTSIWLANADIFLIGSNERLAIDYDRVLERLGSPEIRRLLKEIDLEDPEEFLSTFLMNEDMARAFSEGAMVITDDMPVVEFTGPRSLALNTVSPNIARLVSFREPVTGHLEFKDPEVGRDVGARLERKFHAVRENLIGRAYYAAEDFPRAVEYFDRALAIDPSDRSSLRYKRKLGFVAPGP